MRYLQDLRKVACRDDCAVHAYVLMTNPVYLLMPPAALEYRRCSSLPLLPFQAVSDLDKPGYGTNHEWPGGAP